MDRNLQRSLDGKKAYRRKLASLPAGEKMRMLDELRSRAQVLRGKRRGASDKPPLTADNTSQRRDK